MKRMILALSIVMLTTSVGFAANDWFFNPANGDVIEGPVGSPQHYINLGPQPSAAAAQAAARSRQATAGSGVATDPEWFLNPRSGDVVQGPVASPRHYVPLGRHANAAAAQAAARSRQATAGAGVATDPEWFLNPRSGDVVQGPVASPRHYVPLGRHANAAAAQAAARNQQATAGTGVATDPEWFFNPQNGDVVQGPVGSPQNYVSLGRHPNAAAAQAAAKAAGSALPRSR